MRLQTSVTRRKFLGATAAAAGVMYTSARAQGAASDRVRIAGIGMGGRGNGVLRSMARIPNVEIVAGCDLYTEHVARAAKTSTNSQLTPPTEYRGLLDEPRADAVRPNNGVNGGPEAISRGSADELNPTNSNRENFKHAQPPPNAEINRN